MDWLAKAEDPYIPEEWKKLPLPERIGYQNRYYSLLRYRKKWDEYKENTLKRYLKGASPEKEKKLRVVGDRVFNEDFFGPYIARYSELQGKKRWSKRPLEDIRKELAAHEKKYQKLFKAAIAKL
jgi:hypothetical protein